MSEMGREMGREMGHRSALIPASTYPATRNLSSFLQALYRALFHRPATRDELAKGINAMRSSGRHQLVAALFHSDDAFGRQVSSLYANLLGRTATDVEIVNGIACLRCGQALDKLIASILAGDEYADSAARRHPEMKPAVAMVIAAYNDLLQRMPADSEVLAAAERLAVGNRGALVLSILRCVEYRANFIDDLYQQLMHRSATPTEIHPWTQRGHQSLDLQRARLNLLASDEFFQRWS